MALPEPLTNPKIGNLKREPCCRSLPRAAVLEFVVSCAAADSSTESEITHMFSKSTIKLGLGCVFATLVGFAATVMAWPYGGNCEACHLGCWQGYVQCINSGYTQYQCQQSVSACIYYECNNCIIP